jgi:hypothetical protein
MKEFVHVINVVSQHNIEWLEGDDLVKVMDGFKTFFGIPFIHGTIDVIQIHLYKRKGSFVGNFFLFKFKGYCNM